MKLTLRILAVAAGAWACLSPFVWLIFCNGWLGPRGIATIVFASSAGLVVHTFRRVPLLLWSIMLLVLLCAASVGFFHHFRDSGESGPLPYEWLNGYWSQALPLLLLSIASFAIQKKSTKNEGGGRTTASIAINEPAAGGSI